MYTFFIFPNSYFRSAIFLYFASCPCIRNRPINSHYGVRNMVGKRSLEYSSKLMFHELKLTGGSCLIACACALKRNGEASGGLDGAAAGSAEFP